MIKKMKISENLLVKLLGPDWERDITGQQWFTKDLYKFYSNHNNPFNFAGAQSIEGYWYWVDQDILTVSDEPIKPIIFLQLEI